MNEDIETYIAIGFSILFGISELLGRSSSEHNSITDVALSMFGLTRIKKNTDIVEQV